MNRIKVISDPAELVPILRCVDTETKQKIFHDLSNEWLTAKQIEERYGPEGDEALQFFEKVKIVETKWQTSAAMSPEKAYHAFYSSFHINATVPVQEISDILFIAMMPDKDYKKYEERLMKMIGDEGRFMGDVADELKVSPTTLKALVKRSARFDFRGHRILKFKE